MSRNRPSPAEFLEVLRYIEALMPSVEDDFNHLHGFAWSAKATFTEKVKAPRPDPTGSLGTQRGDQGNARSLLRAAFRLAESSLTKMEQVAELLDKGFGENWDTGQPYPYHRKITDAERAASHDAKQRRLKHTRGRDSVLSDPGKVTVRF